MPITEKEIDLLVVDSENGDFDITSTQTVLTHTLENDGMYYGRILAGDGVKNLDATGGDFELTVSVGGNVLEPSPQTVTFGTNARSAVQTAPFVGKSGEQVLLKIKSPNVADTDVDVSAELISIQ